MQPTRAFLQSALTRRTKLGNSDRGKNNYNIHLKGFSADRNMNEL